MIPEGYSATRNERLGIDSNIAFNRARDTTRDSTSPLYRGRKSIPSYLYDNFDRFAARKNKPLPSLSHDFS